METFMHFLHWLCAIVIHGGTIVSGFWAIAKCRVFICQMGFRELIQFKFWAVIKASLIFSTGTSLLTACLVVNWSLIDGWHTIGVNHNLLWALADHIFKPLALIAMHWLIVLIATGDVKKYVGSN